MGGRLHILVLVVVAVAARTSSQRNDMLGDLAERCRNTVGEQAAVDLLNGVPQFITCTKFEDMYGEIVRAMETNNLKEAFENICRQKDELLTCFDSAFEKIKRCSTEEGKPVIAILQRSVEAFMDFLCENDDAIVAIIMSQDEKKCFSTLGLEAASCYDQNIGKEDVLDSLDSLEQLCNWTDGVQKCINDKAGICKDSKTLSLFNAMVRDVVNEAICSETTISDAASLLARVGNIPDPLNRLILAVTVPYILRL